MKHQNINIDQSIQAVHSSTVMRAPIDQYHFLELTFNKGADTQ